MRVLVIGGSRYVGARLVNLLVNAGHHVTVLNRGMAKDSFGQSVKRIVLDRAKILDNKQLLKGQSWDVVYDQVCYEAWDAKTASEVFSKLTDHYVFTSTQSVYSPGPKCVESDFDPAAFTCGHEVSRFENYGLAKRQCESVFFSKIAQKVTCVRFPSIFGEDDYSQRLEKFLAKILNDEEVYLPSLDAEFSLIHSADAAKFLGNLLSIGPLGTINVCSADSISNRSLLAIIEDITRKQFIPSSDKNCGIEAPFSTQRSMTMNISKYLGYCDKPMEVANWMPKLIQYLKENSNGNI